MMPVAPLALSGHLSLLLLLVGRLSVTRQSFESVGQSSELATQGFEYKRQSFESFETKF